MERLISALPSILKAAGDSAEVAEAACIAAWKHAAGEGLRDQTRALRLSEGTLIVAVTDSTWQRQLKLLSSQLLSRLSFILGRRLVTALEFRVDPESMAKRPDTEGRNAPSSDIESEVIPLELIAGAAEIQDSELRRAFLGAAMSCIKRVDKRGRRGDLRSEIEI